MGITRSSLMDPSPMANLPSEMIITILQNLTPPDLKSVRQVSRRFRDIVDSAVPLPVTIDHSQPGNLRFVRRIVKSEAKICSLRTKTSLIPARKPQLLKRLDIICRIPSNLFSNEIVIFGNLQTLVLGGDALLKKIPLAKSIYLPNLTRLELNSAFCENEHKGSLNTLENTVAVAKNTLGFLTFIHCPVIQELTLDGDVDQGRTLLDEKLDWKQGPLTKFIEKYQKTLKKVLIGESSILKSFETTSKSPCSSLNYLHISFFGNEGSSRNFWANFAGSQRQLEVLNLGALWYRNSHELFEELPKTIVNLTLYWNLSESLGLDARIFASYANLERLELTFDGAWGSLQYFNQFELLKNCTKLMVLVCEQILIPAQDLEKITELFPRLRVCYLYLVGDPKYKLDVESAPFGITEVALTKLISASTKHSLSYLYLCTQDFLGDERTKMEMVKKLSKVGYKRAKYEGYFVGTEPENLKKITIV